MSIRRFITVSNEFEALHYWSKAPKEVEFLRDKHRHIFHVRTTVNVEHNDRDIEFILLKRDLNRALDDFKKLVAANPTFSCEDVCEYIIEYIENNYKCSYIKVSCFEDNENGAELIHENTNLER